MSDVAIHCESLSKLYRIGPHAHCKALRDVMSRAMWSGVRRLFRTLGNSNGRPISSPSEFWALKDVSFEVRSGEVLGVIGRNGAGKSTLLKVLSRITEPTEGKATIYGRVRSLLEVGTGFHSELSGRENIYLNGAILGMKKNEIDRKFDEIVAFADINDFIDTPVKHYSSGMYIRLAFAVAAHLEPEILLVDEVLAVGDLAFQKKCLDKMDDVTHQGRTILLVSHNMATISNLCKRAILLDQGRVVMCGDTPSVVDRYLGSSMTATVEAQASPDIHKFGDELNFQQVRVLGVGGTPRAQVGLHEGARLEIQYTLARPVAGMTVFFRLENSKGICVLTSSDVDQDPEGLCMLRQPGSYRTRCHIPPQYLRPGRYFVDLEAGIPSVRWLDRWPRAIAFDVVDTGSVESKTRHGKEGVIAPVLEWES